MIIEYLIIVLFLCLSLLFVGTEAALSHSDRIYFEFLKSQKNFSGKVLCKLTEAPTLVSGILLGSYFFSLTIVNWYIFQFFTRNFFELFPYSASFIAFAFIFFLSLALAIFSRILFLSFPQQTLKAISIIIYVFYWLFYPLMYIIVFLPANFLKKKASIEKVKSKNIFMYSGLGFYFQYENDLQENDWEEQQKDKEIDNKILNNALSFKTVRVKECMIPRTEISATNLKDSIEDVTKLAIESGHSKILIYRETIDDIIGYCHILELFKKPKSIEDIISPIIAVTEMTMVNDLLARFNEERKSIALVVDEFGGTSGLITMEDVVEVIFGEIQDEYDQSEDWIEDQVDTRTYLLSARHEIHYLNEKYDWELPEGEYETLGGLVIANIGSLPEAGAIVKSPPFIFEVLSVKGTKVETIKVSLIKPGDTE